MSLRPISTRYAEVTAYITKDRSEIRELMHPAQQAVSHQSLAEATVPPGATTLLHRHRATEEIYHFTAGRGVMRLGEREFAVQRGDTVVIGPGIAHQLRNTGRRPLRLLCACSPAYDHADTELLEA